MILFSFSIHFVSDPSVSVDCCSFVTAFCSWFDIPSFLVIPLFKSLYDVCIVCYTFNIYLTTLFDVYCMLFWLIRCMGRIHQNVHLYPPWVLSLAPHFCGLTYVHVLSLCHLYPSACSVQYIRVTLRRNQYWSLRAPWHQFSRLLEMSAASKAANHLVVPLMQEPAPMQVKVSCSVVQKWRWTTWRWKCPYRLPPMTKSTQFLL